ncbi:MAG: hypothetical protein IPK27_05165 [Rhodanobacteraceae bacterium]|nr:hypothetical protein [Rhodanobacteraceae bacterium]
MAGGVDAGGGLAGGGCTGGVSTAAMPPDTGGGTGSATSLPAPSAIASVSGLGAVIAGSSGSRRVSTPGSVRGGMVRSTCCVRTDSSGESSSIGTKITARAMITAAPTRRWRRASSMEKGS